MADSENKLPIKYLVAGIMFLVGIVAVIAITALDEQKTAEENWQKQAQAQALDATNTWTSWLRQYQETLLSTLVVYEASDQVTSNEFFEIVEHLEYSWEQNRTVEVAIIQAQDKQISIIESSIINPVFQKGNTLSHLVEISSALQLVDSVDRMVLLPIVEIENNRWVSILISAVDAQRENSLYALSVIDLAAVFKNLNDLKLQTGLSAQVLVQSDQQSKFMHLPFSLNGDAPSQVFNFEMRQVAMGAQWLFIWSVDSNFNGGPDLGKFKLILIGGLVLLFLAAIFGGLLLMEIRHARQESIKREKAEDRLKTIAHYDTVTKLPNRFSLTQKLDSLISEASRSDFQLSVCFLDLDDFKSINDQYGHHIGDVLLQSIANRLKGKLRGHDVLGRIGGDEFILLVKTRDPMELNSLLLRFVSYFKEPFEVDGNLINCSCSIGVAIYPECGESSDTLLRHADQAMFESKQSSRKNISYFNSSVDKAIRDKKDKLIKIESALNKNEFVLFYQPKVDFKTGAVFGCEALIRWRDPNSGLLSPGEFLPVIEGSRLDTEIGFFVIQKAVEQIKVWHEKGLDLEVSVNVPSVLFQGTDFFPRLNGLLEEYEKTISNLLQFEILETVALSSIDNVKSIIHGCNKLGISFALDDFGTGYSSLSYLNDIATQVIKIDRSFTNKLGEEKGGGEVIRAIIKLSKIFKRKVIAEGIETKEQGKRLIELGCDQGQGYFIAKPMPAYEFENWFKDYKFEPVWQKQVSLNAKYMSR